MNNKDLENLFVCSFALLVLIIITPLMAIAQGWVLTILWSWFIVPVFGLPKLSIVVAIGLSLIVGMFRGYSNTQKSEELETSEKIGKIIGMVLAPFLILFMGWIVHLFM